MNLTDLLKDQLLEPLAGKAASYFNESESGVTKALGGILPTILGKATEMSESKNGLSTIFDMAKGADNSLLDNIGDLFSSQKKMDGLLQSGSGILSTLFGNNLGSLIGGISQFSGLGKDSTSSLFKMASPLIMSFLGRQITKNGLDANGLGKLLSNNKKGIFSMIPSALSSILGWGGDLANSGSNIIKGGFETGKDVASKAGEVAMDVAETGVKTGKSLLKWLLPLFLILLLASYFGFRTGCASVDNTVDATKDGVGTVADGMEQAADAVADGTKKVASGAAEMAGEAADAVGTAATAIFDGIADVFGKVNETAKAALDKITFKAGSAGEQMIRFIDNGFKGEPVFRFNDLTFEHGSAEITSESAEEVDHLAAILKAYPNVNIRLDGYTDNTGDSSANIQLSQDRADAVKTRLRLKGIGAGRISTMGHGAANPVADNATEEGRAQNRRIEITIVK